MTKNDLGPTSAYRWRLHNAGRLMSNALRRFEDRVLALLSETWPQATRRSHVNLTRHLDLEGTRITELARRAAMTNAAMTELIDQCEVIGLVERAADPTDKRARVVRFTAMGRDWLMAFGEAVERAQAEMLREVGEPGMSSLLKTLERYARGSLESAPGAEQGDDAPPGKPRAAVKRPRTTVGRRS